MADSSQSDNGGPQPQQVNLQQIAQQFMAGLQRHFDMLAFNLAAREGVSEEGYGKFAHAPKIMPAAKSHQNFEQMQAYARDLLMRQVLGDGMNLTVTAMNNAHFFLALVKATKANSQVSPEAQEEAQKIQQAFASAPLDQKFNKLEQDYGIMCELEDSITSLGFCLQALLHQSGLVKEPQLDESGELVVDLKALKVLSRGGEGDQLKGKLVDQQKRFVEGDVIVFSDLELQLVLVTIASFADALFKSVSHYAKSIKDQTG
ncbi:MAG TPA: hypothetical protein VJ952_13485 [Opitutales bacterium]|nr:hypothetical protein [Opitutales bacterium]